MTDPSNIRFNKLDKLDCVKKEEYDAIFPLTPNDYPLSGDTAVFARFKTYADAVVVEGDRKFAEVAEFTKKDGWETDPVTHFELKPLYPGHKIEVDGKEKSYWSELEVVVDAQLKRIDGVRPSELQKWPKIWGDFDLEDIADAVDGEYPASIQATFIETVYTRFKEESDRMDRIQRNLGQPYRSFNDFIGNQIRMGAINTWSFEAVAPVNFYLKWNYGVPRSEEVCFKIFNKEVNGVPEILQKKIDELGQKVLDESREKQTVLQDDARKLKGKRMRKRRRKGLKKKKHGKSKKIEEKKFDEDSDDEDPYEFTAKSFTAYEGTGSPNHPSFPAMHSAGSTVSLWLPALYKITGKEYLEALRVDFAVSYARTVAGVHYPQDNIAGLNIGQRIIRNELPEFMSKNYGYSKDKIKERVEFLSFDWSTFKSEAGTYKNCNGEEKSAIEHLKAFNEKFPEPKME